MSLFGHLGVAALIIGSLAVVTTRMLTVAPDRVQIMEIDLSTIKITKDLTELYNLETIDLPRPEEKTTTKQVEVPPPTQKSSNAPPVPQPESKPIEAPTVIDIGDDEPAPPPPPQKKDDPPKPAAQKPANENAQRSLTRQTVRVNRDTLTRTMTISVVDALRAALTRCWVIDTDRADISDLRIVVHLTMFDTGMVRDMWMEEVEREEIDTGFAYAAETIRTAIKVCQPFSMLPKSEFEEWKTIQVTFYPKTASVQ